MTIAAHRTLDYLLLAATVKSQTFGNESEANQSSGKQAASASASALVSAPLSAKKSFSASQFQLLGSLRVLRLTAEMWVGFSAGLLAI